MEIFKDNQLNLVVHDSTTPLDMLNCQKELFLTQINQFEDIVVNQCKLTGVNPLSQEMAAGALSIKIGKRPRDLLNPKAIKYMHSIFSIKDAISKKECREISALFGVTVTQVREFFAVQRSRVRKFVRLSKEKASRSNASVEAQDSFPSASDSDMPINPVPLNCLTPANTEGPSCSTQDDVLPDIDESDRHFMVNIISSMRKENTFSGQVNLMEWISRIQNPAVLYWFLTEDGVMILATWLSQAAIEEQTSVLHVILKVLCHLPLHKARPVHMSAILQSVNKLRFYRASDISTRARILLSRWSKVFARSQAMKKSNAIKSLSETQGEMLLKRSIGEVMGSELWGTEIDNPEETGSILYGSTEKFRKVESPQLLKLLTASTDDNNKKPVRGVFSSQTRERRKVLLVEQPGQQTSGRSPQVSKPAPTTQSRPLSADDIQKAKMRAQFLQNKYGKSGTSSNESPEMKTDGPSKCSSWANVLLSASRANVMPVVEPKPQMHPSKASNQQEVPVDNKMILDLNSEEPLWKRCTRVKIQWKMAPEIKVDVAWRVGTGDGSKEVDVQRNRTCREKEITYRTNHEIPLDPKEPWDREMDHDDTLTPEIPIEQLPDDDSGGGESTVRTNKNEAAVTSTSNVTSQNAGGSMPEPDLELLAVLLKNPELVYALTSGQGGNLSNEETMNLLDRIKANGVTSLGNLNGFDREAEKRVEVSLPSPTPSSDPVMSGRRPELTKNPFSRQNTMANTNARDIRRIAGSIPSQEKLPSGNLIWPQISSNTFTVPQHPANVPHVSQQGVHQLPLSQTAPSVPTLNLTAPGNANNIQIPVPNLLGAAAPPPCVESVANLKTAPVAVGYDIQERTPIALPTPSLSTSTQIQARLQVQQAVPIRTHELPRSNTWGARQRDLGSNNLSLDNQNSYNAFPSRPKNATLFGPGSWERNNHGGGNEFESWSPHSSPTRRQEYMPEWNYPWPRITTVQNHREESSRSRDHLGYRDHRDNRSGNRRWHDRRR